MIVVVVSFAASKGVSISGLRSTNTRVVLVRSSLDYFAEDHLSGIDSILFRAYPGKKTKGFAC